MQFENLQPNLKGLNAQRISNAKRRLLRPGPAQATIGSFGGSEGHREMEAGSNS